MRLYSSVYLNNFENKIVSGISRFADNFLKSSTYILLNFFFYKERILRCVETFRAFLIVSLNRFSRGNIAI